MTPKTRQRKSRLANEHTQFVDQLKLLDKKDVVDFVILSMKNMGLYEDLKSTMQIGEKLEIRGRKMTPYPLRKLVWDFYHENATPSTNTSRPAKLKVSERNKIQIGLDFVDTTTVIIQRKKQFYQNIWMMLHITYQELYLKYGKTYPDNIVSLGTFRSLKPFYIRTATEKDIEMCCCKLHLHARWTIEALVNCALQQEIDIPFSDYTTFFDFLTRNCEKSTTAYISWSCTENKNVVCNDITEHWNDVSGRLVTSSSKVSLVTLTTFQMVEYKKKNGDTAAKLKPVPNLCSMTEIVSFLNGLLPNIINHKNHLRHYRTVVHSFRAIFDAVFVDIDFSENLKIPTHKEPQSMHWCYETMTVHSGILKLHGEKSYHPILSDDKKHDQPFVKISLEKMLDTVDSMPEICVIESDNCSSQYKSAQHFDDIQYICNKIGVPVLRVFSIAGHGKGEVDHVGGTVKCAIRRYVGTSGSILNAEEGTEFISQKFSEKTNPTYIVQQLHVDDLEESRKEARLKKYPTITGSDNFQVMVFQPNSVTFRASPYLCICEICMTKYGSCPLFSSYELRTQVLKKIHLRAEVQPVGEMDGSDDHDISEFLLADTYCAVATDEKSSDTVWFIKIKDSYRAQKQMTDDYNNSIAPGMDYIEGKFMEKFHIVPKGTLYTLSKKKTYFFKESVVYPFVQFTAAKKGFLLSNEEFVTILNYIESTGLSSI